MERSRYLQLRREYEPDNLTLLMWRCLLLSPVCIFTIRLPELARHISTLPISSFRPRADHFRSSPMSVHFRQSRQDSKLPLATNAPQQTASLFDHLIGAGKQRRWHGEVERLRSLVFLVMKGQDGRSHTCAAWIVE
jgi:hypothetical protein